MSVQNVNETISFSRPFVTVEQLEQEYQAEAPLLSRTDVILLKVAVFIVKIMATIFLIAFAIKEPSFLIPLSIVGVTYVAYKKMVKEVSTKD